MKNILEQIKVINNKYDLSNETVNQLLTTIDTAKVCVPIIGSFSTGKSALLNTILGYGRKLLQEDITPETALPTEIMYGEEDLIKFFLNNGEIEEKTLLDYLQSELKADEISKIQLQLSNEVLKEFSDVMLVDMPGFDSGLEIHNKAIDNYLPQSMAYMIAFPADNMIVKTSVGEILKELCLHDMSICIVITKYDKRGIDFENSLENLKKSLRKYLGDHDITYCITSSAEGEVDEVIKYLNSIQNQSCEIINHRFKGKINNSAILTESYLNTCIKNNDLSISELAVEENKLQRELDKLNHNFIKEKEIFNNEVIGCTEEIKNDIALALESDERTIVTMTMNNHDVKDHLNCLIRTTVTDSVQRHLTPIISRYVKRVSTEMDSDEMNNFSIPFFVDVEEISEKIGTTVVAGLAAWALGGPVIGVITAVITKIISKNKVEKKRDQQKQEITEKIRNDIIPKIVTNVGVEIEKIVNKQVLNINNLIEENVQNQRITLEKALKDLQFKSNEESITKENLKNEMLLDLKRIEGIKNELQ